MRKMTWRSSTKAGMPPGSLVHVGERRTPTPEITIVDYDAERVVERNAHTVQECIPFRDTPTVTWINIAGIHDIGVLRELGECYGIHPLVMEDILNTHQRPKFQEFEEYLFIVLKSLSMDPAAGEIEAEQVSLIIGPNLVISFEEAPTDVFEAVRERLRTDRSRLRSSGADYLAYCLLDTVVDHYYVVLEAMSGQIEEAEDEILGSPSQEMLQRVHHLKRELIFLRKSVWPLREVLALMARADTKLIRDSTDLYLRDVYEHTIQIVDTIEALRDVVSGMHDTYLSSVSYRLNDVMKVLTIFASIFIPLTFLAGVYGMNFDYMPELRWRYGYYAIWGVMVAAAAAMLAFFRRRKWF